MQPEKSKYTPTEMETKHVYQVYDRIAPHFSHTRYKPWPLIQDFLNQLPAGSFVFDIGCGNGKYLGINKEIYTVGTDRSMGLLQNAQEKSDGYELFAADCLNLPLRSDLCDAFLCIAVIHHFSKEQLRKKAITEAIRVTKVGGQGLIYVWSFQHGDESVSKKKFTEQDNFVPWHLNFKHEKDLIGLDLTNAKVDMKNKSVAYDRYYHVFKKGELDSLLQAHSNIQIISSYYDKENWACRVKKISA